MSAANRQQVIDHFKQHPDIYTETHIQRLTDVGDAGFDDTIGELFPDPVNSETDRRAWEVGGVEIHQPKEEGHGTGSEAKLIPLELEDVAEEIDLESGSDSED